MAFHHELVRRPGIACQPAPRFVERGLGLVIIRHVPGWHAGKLFQPEVYSRFKANDVAMALQQKNKRQKESAGQSFLIEIARREIRGRDHDDAEFEQSREETAEDHCVGDVGDMEFVEARHPTFFRYHWCRALNRIELSSFAVLELLPEDMNTFVYVGHEFVKMNSSLWHARPSLKEQTHQHGLAAADFAVNVQTFERRPGVLALPEQPTKR